MMTNAQAQAYAVIASRNIGIADVSMLKKLDYEMYRLFDELTEQEAELKALKLFATADREGDDDETVNHK
ncbi:MAG: hypothetical protein ACYCYO_01665 [Bacilli bacterium]